MIKVFFDHQAFTMQKYGGISRYFSNLYNYLNQQEDISCKISLLYTTNYYLSDESFPIHDNVGRLLFKKASRLAKWNKAYSQYLVGRNDFDVFHPTYYHPYFLSKLRQPFVLTIHDMIHELLPEYFLPHYKDSYNKRLLIEKASHIIAISESTRNDIQQIYGLPDDKISVIYHGYESKALVLSSDFQIPYPNYILFVGERIRYKNFSRLLAAYAQLLPANNDIHLLCIGGGQFEIAELEQISRFGLSDFVHQISVSDSQLNKLYQNALLFVYPSLYEGFGLPLLEAFDNGCPVAVSNTSCFKEVGGDAVVYFNPYNPQEIKQAMETLIFDRVLAHQLKEKGFKQLKKFSMEKCLLETQEVYKKLV